jgi:rSAM/selenodomain-associated transferase 2
MISVIIPTFDSAPTLARTLAPLIAGVAQGVIKEAIVVDGGSSDDTIEIVEAAGCDVVRTGRGRARQLIEGARRARSPWLLFLNADTSLAPGWLEEAQRFMRRPGAQSRAAAFRFALDDDCAEARRVVSWMRFRCGVTKLPGGEQGLLISRRLYDMLGGYQQMELMEDVDLARRIGAKRLVLFDTEAVVSAERYQRDGFARRAWEEFVLLARYRMGADPGDLAKPRD